MNDVNMAACIWVTGLSAVLASSLISRHLARSANALERIADALEGKDPDENDDDLEQ